MIFKKVKSEFLSNIGKFRDEVRKCDDIIVKADKTRNIYTLKKEEYNKLLNNNITKGYHKTDGNTSWISTGKPNSMPLAYNLGTEWKK